jgi:hypothetical protein
MDDIPERPLLSGIPRRPGVCLRQPHQVDSTFHHHDAIPSTRQQPPSIITRNLQLELSSWLDPRVATQNRRLGLYRSVVDNVPLGTGRERSPSIEQPKLTRVCTPASVLCVMKFPLTKQFLADSQ